MKYDQLLSIFALNVNLRPYTAEFSVVYTAAAAGDVAAGGLTLVQFQLNLSTVCGIFVGLRGITWDYVGLVGWFV